MTATLSGLPAAISMTYDGCEPAELCLPALEENGFAGTVYLSPTELLKDPEKWRQAKSRGHEIAAHPLRGYTDETGALPNWPLSAVRHEVADCIALFDEVLEQETRSAALDGDRHLCMRDGRDRTAVDYARVFDDRFDLIRTSAQGRMHPALISPKRLQSISFVDYDQAMREIELSISRLNWIIFRCFVGESDLDSHDRVCAELKRIGDAAFVAPVIEVAACAHIGAGTGR